MIDVMSKAGSYHAGTNTENQDAVLWASSRRFVGLFLADGMSSCTRSGAGARLSCEAMKNLLMKKGEALLSFEEAEIADFTVSHVLHELKKKAAVEGRCVDDYSSTMACALMDRKTGKLLTLNLGDGLIGGVRKNGAVTVLSMPADSSGGCCGTTTVGAVGQAAIRILDTGDLDAVFLCSDGAWKCMFDGNRIRGEVAQTLREESCGGLVEYLRGAETFDDCSFISMDLKTIGGNPDEPAKILKK